MPLFSKEECAEKIRWVAASLQPTGAFRVFLTPDEFHRRARVAANELGSGAIETVASLMHGEGRPPSELAQTFEPVGSWIAARHRAIFEIYYYFREAALPVLRRAAFGEYDWTQGNAIEVLCRLAADGVERAEIIADLRREFPTIRCEARLYALDPLLRQTDNDPSLAAVLRELENLPAYQDTLEELLEGE